MKFRFPILLAASILFAVAACGPAARPTPAPSGQTVLGVFEGTTPCSRRTRPLPQMPEATDCEQMIWKLVLQRDPQTGSPTTYELDAAFGISKQGTPDLVGEGTNIELSGKWDIAQGTQADADAVVYRLNPDDPPAAVSFLKVGDDIIHILSRDGALLTGNGAWAYTLNRMDSRFPSQAEQEPVTPPEPAPRPPIPPTPAGSLVHGIFDGRTPCHEITLQLTKSTTFPGCMKVKWRLLLYQDRNTGAPSTYLSIGTQDFTHGTWKVLQGAESPSGAVIVQLNPEDSQQPVFFLKADDNHLFLLDEEMNPLVGNALFSYTLSRLDKTVPKSAKFSNVP